MSSTTTATVAKINPTPVGNDESHVVQFHHQLPDHEVGDRLNRIGDYALAIKQAVERLSAGSLGTSTDTKCELSAVHALAITIGALADETADTILHGPSHGSAADWVVGPAHNIAR